MKPEPLKGKGICYIIDDKVDKENLGLALDEKHDIDMFKVEDVKSAVEWLLEELANDKESMFILEDDRGRKYFTQQMIKIMDKIKEAFPDIMEGKE